MISRLGSSPTHAAPVGLGPLLQEDGQIAPPSIPASMLASLQAAAAAATAAAAAPPGCEAFFTVMERQ
jgi:hypothetical protein